nr:helix-turn-helix domain-containing protein [Butyrivibrio sp.]
NNLNFNNALFNDCTYIVCCKDVYPQFPEANTNVNVFFLDLSLQAALNIITQFIREKLSLDTSDDSKMFNDFWKDILYLKIKTQVQVTERMKAFPYEMKRHLACIVVRPEVKPALTDIGKITRQLQEFFEGINLFYTGEEWIVLYSQDKDTSVDLDIDYEAFSDLLYRNGLNAGISYVCQLSEAYRNMYMTAESALDLGIEMEVAPFIKRIYTFHQYNLYYIIHMAAQAYSFNHKDDNFIFLTHPDITRLYYFDKENSNNLLTVLCGYLQNGQNTGLTAQALFMHRNTVINKLNKIEEVLGHKLDYEKDNFLFLISCMIIEYQNNYKKTDISRYFSQHDFHREEE